MTTTSLGHIYKIICKVDEKFCYIGSTFDRLSKRMETHRNHYNRWVNGKTKTICSCYLYFQKYGFENFKIVLIKSYEVCRSHNKDAKHLWAYETLWINKTKCVNKNSPINYLKKEKRREWHEKHREEQNAVSKEYYEKNREEWIAKALEYYEKHKGEIRVKKRAYHEKHKEKHNAKSREWREKNREEINAKKREKVKCEFCGCMSSKGNLKTHQKTKKCLKAQGK